MSPGPPWPVDDQIRILPPKGCGDVAIPAYRCMSGENLLHSFRGEIGPIQRLVFRAEKGRLVLRPKNRADVLAADGARLSDIPSGDDSLQQAVFR